ncbi:MAG: hypothetical protein LC753_01750 [Acidobacteria bacterium]|nr:hypothetical protein [Acidobacteriota bacterium]MCA1649031.1 hypothetical protein [Acidobacteriota bacterium]
MIILTVMALAVALGLGAAAARVLRDERRRSDARIALLAGLADDSLLATPASPMAERDLDLRPSSEINGVAEMFKEPERTSSWGPRLAVAGVVTAAIVIAVAAWPRSETPVSTSDAAVPAQPALPALELVSLRHVQQPGMLTITGLVHNPRGGQSLAGVTATGFVFDGDGGFLASGRAPLDFTALAAGDESPFVITVPVTGSVARYRVGFRAQDGRVIAHVDRRAGAAVTTAAR